MWGSRSQWQSAVESVCVFLCVREHAYVHVPVFLSCDVRSCCFSLPVISLSLTLGVCVCDCLPTFPYSLHQCVFCCSREQEWVGALGAVEFLVNGSTDNMQSVWICSCSVARVSLCWVSVHTLCVCVACTVKTVRGHFESSRLSLRFAGRHLGKIVRFKIRESIMSECPYNYRKALLCSAVCWWSS